MSGRAQQLIEDADSLAAFIETAAEHDIPTDAQADALIRNVWGDDVPTERAIAIIKRERQRIDEFERVSLSASARAPRYMDLYDLELVSGYEFEHILAAILRRVGGEATVTQASGDQGVDVIWKREDEIVGIQAKAYDLNNPVGNSAVQEIHTGAAVTESDYSIDVPAVVTTSRYTDGAKQAAKESGVRLYGRSDLQRWLTEARLDAAAMGTVLDSI